MKISATPVFLIAVCVASLGGPVTAQEASRIGMTVDDFTLRSHLGREWSLSDFRDKDVVVVTFLGTECPLAKLYGRRLAELGAKYADKSVVFVGINANTQDSMTELTGYANRYDIEFPLLKDTGNRVADAMGAMRTPEVFVLDKNREVRYHGRIDDQYAVGISRDKANRDHLVKAVDELLAGKNVSLRETETVGCLIGRVKQVNPIGDVTYSNQIVRIFNKRCVECHREDEIAPFTLTSYDDIVGWEDTIIEVIEDKRMPPWFANPEYGEFHNDARLSQEEKNLIFRWIENGMPEGDPADMPPAPKFTDGWRIPEPDQVLYMRDTPFTVPAQGVVDYQRFIVDPGWDEDKYIYAAEARPGNSAVVHHILVYVISENDGRRRGGGLGNVLVGYAPGSTPQYLEDGLAIHVPAGSKLLFEMHYTPNGFEQDDRSYAGVCFIDKSEVKKLLRGRVAINGDFQIPAHDDNYVVTAAYDFSRDELLLSMTPHMHLRGKSFRYEAAYPDGEREVLLDVPKYDFNWQLKYILAGPKLMPKGTKVICTATYDNSEDNLANPDPNRSVRWGDQSFEEMMIGFFDTLPAEKPRRRLKSKNVICDPSGVWTWKQRFGRRELDYTLTLKLKDDELGGTLVANGEKIEVQDAVIEGDKLTFSVDSTKLRGMTIDFVGKAGEDLLEGEAKIAIDAVGRSFSVPWIARRSDAEAE